MGEIYLGEIIQKKKKEQKLFVPIVLLETNIFNKSDRLAFRHEGLLILRYWS